MPGLTDRFNRVSQLAWAFMLAGVLHNSSLFAQERLPNEPLILKPGVSRVLSGAESKLMEKVVFWTSFPLEIERMEGQTHLRPGKESPLGIHFLRGLAGEALTPWQAVLLEDLPQGSRTGRKNDSRTNPQLLKSPSVITGTIQPNKAEYFELKLAGGESITVELMANRLLSALDPFVRLLDPEGRQLAFNDDEPGLGRDCRVRYTAKAAQTVIVEVRDSYYQGGDKHVYVLRVGDFPVMNTAFDAGGKIAWFGRDSAAQGVGKAGEIAQWFVARHREGGAPAYVTGVLQDGDVRVESEPNDDRARATMIAFPGSVYGRLEKESDTDWYAWEAKKGEKYSVRAQTRSLAFPTEVRLTAHTADGKGMAASKLVTEDEGSLEVTAGADGKIYLRVNHIAGLGGPEHGYRLNLRTAPMGFDTKTEADKVVLPQGGTGDLKVTIDRSGYDGAIEYGLVPQVEGLTLVKATVEAKKKEATLQLKASETLPAGRLHQVRIQAINPPGGHVQNFTTFTNQLGPSATMAGVLNGWITVGIKARAEKDGPVKSP